jgi:hypothetical protein
MSYQWTEIALEKEEMAATNEEAMSSTEALAPQMRYVILHFKYLAYLLLNKITF